MNELENLLTRDSLAKDAWIDALCDRFEAACQAGYRPSIAEFLRSEAIDPDSADPTLVRELSRIDAVYSSSNESGNSASTQTGLVEVPENDRNLILDANPSIAIPGSGDFVPGYQVLGEIARGGMGVVYRAIEPSFGRVVAIKLLHDKYRGDTVASRRFLSEARLTGRLQHPGIPPVFEVGELIDGSPFLAMKLIDGKTLAQVLADARPSTNALMATFEHICQAVAFAHSRGIIHRDLKPANIMVGEFGEVQVMDWGLAKELAGKSETLDSKPTALDSEDNDSTRAGAVLGTPAYMAPEQARGDVANTDCRADVFGLGSLLCEILTGRPPFFGEKSGSSLKLAIEGAVAGAFERLDTCGADPDLVVLCRNCLAPDPADRPANAGAVAKAVADLRAEAEDRLKKAEREIAAAEIRVAEQRKRRRVQLTFAGVVLLFVVGGGIQAVQVRSQRERDRIDREKQRADDQEAANIRLEEEGQRTFRQLWRSQLGEARANSRSGLVGHRFGSLELLRTALATARTTGLSDSERKQFRDVAVAALALPDLEVLKEWEGYPVGTHHLAIDAGFERYARTSLDGAVTVRRVSDDAELYSLPPTGNLNHLSLSDSGKVLVVSDAVGPPEKRVARVHSLDGESAVLLKELPVLLGRNVFVSPDDQRIVSVNSTAVVVWQRKKDQLDTWPLQGPVYGCSTMTKDGRRLAIGWQRGNSWLLHIRDLGTGHVVADLPLPGSVDASAWHPDGRTVAVGVNQKIHIWDVESKRELHVLEGHTNHGITPSFDHTGERLLSNDWSNILRVWDWRAGRQILRMPVLCHTHARLVSADGRVFAGSQDAKRLAILRLDPGLERQPFAVAHAPVLYMHSDPGRRFAVVTQNKPGEFGRPFAIDLARGEELGQLPIPPQGQRCFQVATDGALLTNGYSGIVRWPLSAQPDKGILRFGPPQMILPRHTTDAHSASANGRMIAVPNYNAGAFTLSLDRIGAMLNLGPQHDVRNTAVSANGRFVATGTHSATTEVGIKVWDAQTGGVVAELKDTYGTMSFSPDDRWLAKWGGGFRLWHTDTWIEGPAIPAAETILGCIFSPDSRVLAVTGHSTVRLIRIADGTELLTLPYAELSTIRLQCFSPDGGTLYACGTDTGELVAWDLRRLRTGLAELGLDWDEPPLPPVVAPSPPWRVEFINSVAEEELRKAIEEQEKVVAEFPAVPSHRQDLAKNRNNLGNMLAGSGQGAQAAEQYRKGLVIQEKLVADFPAVAEYQQHLAKSHKNLGRLLKDLGQGSAAEEQYRKALTIHEKQATDFPDVTAYRQELAQTHNSLGLVLAGRNQRAAEEHHRKAVAINEKLVADFPEVLVYHVELGGFYCNIGRLIRDGGNAVESLKWYGRAIDCLQPVRQKLPRDVTANLFLRNSHWGRAKAHDQLQNFPEALKDWDRAIALSQPAEQPKYCVSRATSRLQAGMITEAFSEVFELLTKSANWNGDQWHRVAVFYSVASAKIAEKKDEYADTAISLLQKAIKAGYLDAANLRQSSDLGALRDREDFKKLIAELEKKAQKR